jgi:hypothetical protein
MFASDKNLARLLSEVVCWFAQEFPGFSNECPVLWEVPILLGNLG